jgi:hypothetical protein
MCLDKALEIVLAGDGRRKRLERSVLQVRFFMEKEATLCFAEIRQAHADYACARREITMHLAGSRRVSWP